MPKINRNCQEIIVGIDPGISGGIVASIDGKLEAHDNTRSCQELLELLSRFSAGDDRTVTCFVEEVHGYVGINEKMRSPQAFAFGRSYGQTLMGLAAAKVPYNFVASHAWQSGLGLRRKKKGEADKNWKHYLRLEAERIFPNRGKITLKQSDAYLIHEYARRWRLGIIKKFKV